MVEIPVNIDGVYQCVGRVRFYYSVDLFAQYLQVPDIREAVLVAVWDKSFPYLHIRGRARRMEPGQTGERRLTSKVLELQEHFSRVVGRVPQLDSKRRCYCGGQVETTDALFFEFMVDTDSCKFCEAAKKALEAGAEELKINVYLYVYYLDPDFNTRDPISQSVMLRLALKPLSYPPEFRGVVAIDIGNTNSSLACFDLRAGLSSQALRLLPDLNYLNPPDRAQLTEDGDPIQSCVRIDAVVDARAQAALEFARALGLERPEGLLEMMEGFAWRIGAWAHVAEEGPTGLVVSPKRALARSGTCAHLEVETRLSEAVPPEVDWDVAARDRVTLPSTRPAELLVCRLFQLFRLVQRQYAHRLVVTYPTSYSSSEVAQLRKTVYQGWLMAERQNPGKHPPENRLIALTLDEATAAAFFYLTRRILDRPGGLHTFRYLYPDGFSLLVYDCGGATVDIALVQAKAPDPSRLCFTVLGRTGLRDFGGDDITVAIFLLLKAKLAYALSQAFTQSHLSDVPAPPGPVGGSAANPTFAQKLREYLSNEEILAKIDSWVPTDFDPASSGTETMQRQHLTLVLWAWAEEVKRRLSAGRPIGGLGGYYDRVTKLLLQCGIINEADRTNVADLMEQLRISTTEVDALIAPHVRRSIECCRSLLRSKLSDIAGLVDDVFVVGNGSLYPLIRSMLRKELIGEDLGSDLADWWPSLSAEKLQFSESDLKHAVAKGAALALAFQEAGLGMSLEFDAALSDRLPYTIAWFNEAVRAAVSLFPEGKRFGDLHPAKLEVPIAADGSRVEWIRLMCRWPGRDYENFLRFPFPGERDPVVYIEFEPQSRQFFAYSPETGRRVPGERDISDDIYRAPSQRGKIRLSL